MAKPIKETPVLTGEDAARFWEEAENVVPVSAKEREDAERLFKSLVAKNPEIFSLI